MTLRKVRPGEPDLDPSPPSGADAISLVTQLTVTCWELAGLEIELQRITLTGGFEGGFTWGAVDVVTGYSADSADGGGGAVVPATIARWPGARGCAPRYEGAVVPLDARFLPFSAEDVGTRLGEATGTLTWDDGGSTPLTLRFEPVGGSACAPDREPGLDPRLLFDGRLHLHSDDGRVDAALEVVVDATLGEDGHLESELAARHRADFGDSFGPVPADTFDDDIGIRGFDLTDYDEVFITLDATIVDAATTGSFELRARGGETIARPVGGASWTVP